MDPEDPTRLVDHPDDSRSSVYTKPDDPRSSGSLPYPDDVHGPPRGHTEESRSSVFDDVDPRMSPFPDPKTQPEIEALMPSSCVDDPTWMRVGDIGVDGVVGVGIGGVIAINADDAFTPASSSSSRSRASSNESDDEDTFVEVEHTRKAKKVKKTAKVKIHPDSPRSSLSNEKSLKHLQKKCGISEKILLVAPTPVDWADAPPPGYMTLFENYFDQYLLWFPLPRFLMRFLAVHGVCLAQINPRGIRHILGIYVLSKECGVVISTEHLSYLTDYRVRGRSEELKHTVTNSSGMALIVGFPSKDDHFEDRFFFVEISERTVEADLAKTRWEKRVKPSLLEVSEEFVTAMHKELSSGNGSWRKSFSRKRIENTLSVEIFPGKILGRGQARASFHEQATLEAASKAKGSSGTSTPRVAMPTTSTPLAPSARARSSRPLAPKTLLPLPSSGDVAEFCRLSAERARISSGKEKGVDRMTPSKRQRVDTFPAAVIGRETSASRVSGLLRDKAYSVVTSKASELSLFFDCLVSDYDEHIRSRDSELSAAKEANAALQSRLDELAEQNKVLERDALSTHKGELSSASDLQCSRIEDAVAEVRDEMARGFSERTSEFIGLLLRSDPPDLSMEVKTMRKRRHPIYDAHNVFADLLASVRRVLEIPADSAGVAEASVVVDDDVEVSEEDDVEATDDDEDAED
ncbi:hypothetical protein AALP_AAs67853U000100 [Arabis alpina]|uniref:Uncharacterized protein n=1 Tax=Arabis alpina TaxID=50452 RepID=A0A087FZ92_ARAAL|nr:hypothetical protein AALP_AAs67853U000100 [Arabis alpina]